jgi:hypothetical protein
MERNRGPLPRRDDTHEYRVGRLKHERVMVPRGEELLEWAMQVMKYHGPRKAVLEVGNSYMLAKQQSFVTRHGELKNSLTSSAFVVIMRIFWYFKVSSRLFVKWTLINMALVSSLCTELDFPPNPSGNSLSESVCHPNTMMTLMMETCEAHVL